MDATKVVQFWRISMPGLSQPIRFMSAKTQLKRFPWQRYQELLKIQGQVDEICQELQRALGNHLQVLATLPGYDKNVKPPQTFASLMAHYALHEEDCKALNNRLGAGFSAGGTSGKYLANWRSDDRNPFYQVTQEQVHGERNTIRQAKIEAFDAQLDTNIGRLIIHLKSGGKGWKQLSVWAARSRLKAMRARLFDMKEKTAKTDNEKKRSVFKRLQSMQTPSRKMMVFQLLMFSLFFVGCLAVIAATGAFGAPLVAFVGIGAVKTLLAPAVWLASLGGAKIGGLFIAKTIMYGLMFLNSIHSLLYIETKWRLWPFHKPHLSTKLNTDVLVNTFNAFKQQLATFAFLRLPDEQHGSNKFSTYNNSEILLKTLCNPLRLVYATLYISHGLLNLAIDIMAHVIGFFIGRIGNEAGRHTSIFIANLLKAPLDVLLTGVAMVVEVLVKITDVVWSIAFPLLGKLTFGTVQAIHVYRKTPVLSQKIDSSKAEPSSKSARENDKDQNSRLVEKGKSTSSSLASSSDDNNSLLFSNSSKKYQPPDQISSLSGSVDNEQNVKLVLKQG